MQSVLTLAPGGSPLGQSLGFTAAAVQVDNLTPDFLVLTDVGRTVAPWFVGVVIPLPDGIRQANASLTATTPPAPGPAVPKQQCTLTWTDQVLPANPGHPLSQAGYGVSTLVLTLDAAVGADVTKFLDLPAGTQTVAFKTTVTSGSLVRPAILTIADKAGTSYLVQNPVNDTSWAFASVVDAAGLEVELNNNIGPGNTAFETLVYASPLPLQTSPLSVNISAVGASPLTAGQDKTAGGSASIPVVPAEFYTPAPWQAALSSAGRKDTPGALNTDFTIVAGVAGKIIYVHSLTVNTNAGQTWEVHLWDGPSVNGLRIAVLFMVEVTATAVGEIVFPPVTWDGRGRPLTAGNALVATIVTGPAATTVFGTYGYSQA